MSPTQVITVTAALVGILSSAIAAWIARGVRRRWRWARSQLELLTELQDLPAIRQAVIEHDQVLVDHGWLPPPHRRPYRKGIRLT